MQICHYIISTKIIIKYCCTTVPSAPPEDVSVSPLSPTSISLTWSPPPVDSQNGVIREYRINITEVDTGRVILLNSTTTSLTVPALHPYYTYLCSIAASTIASGPFTEVIIVTTPEDGMYISYIQI